MELKVLIRRTMNINYINQSINHLLLLLLLLWRNDRTFRRRQEIYPLGVHLRRGLLIVLVMSMHALS